MRATGIVRRMDDLGRIVIPKELRRTLRIRVGDPLEIYVDKGEVIFKKYQPFASIEDYAQEICSSLFDNFQNAVFIADEKNIVAVAGEKKKGTLKKPVDIVLPLFEGVEEVLFVEETTTLKVIDEEREVHGYIYIPIFEAKKRVGSIIMLGTKKQVDNIAITVMGVHVEFMQKQVEASGY